MKNLKFLSSLGSWAGSHRSMIKALTVGSPSVHRRGTLLKLMSILVLILTIGVGQMWGAETLVYTLDGTTTAEDNGYATESSITQSSKSWKVTGNTTTNPWRIGGKKISNVDRPIYTTFTFTDDISKVTVETGTSTLDAVNSITLIVSSSQNGGGTVTSSLAKTSSLTSTTLTFERPEGKDWSGKYFAIVFNVSKSANSNAYIQFKNAKFYKETGGSVAVTGVSITPTSKSIVPGETFDITPTVLPAGATNKAVSWTSSATSKATVSNGTVTGVAAGSSTITCTTTDGGFTATCAVTVCGVTMQARDEDGNEIPSGGPGAPSCTGKSITPAADANNYVFKEWQIENADLGSSASAKSNTITNPTGAVTVTAVYHKPITITYKANGETFTTQTYGHGGTLAFPASNPDGATYSCTGKTFTGWVAEANKDYSHATDAPTYATAG